MIEGMKPFTPEDLCLHQKLTELHCVPGLEIAAGTVRSVDREGDQYLSCIWAFSLDGAPARQLTHGPGLDNTPRWSPKGDQLAFLSNRAGGSPQLYLMPRDGGESRQLGQFDQSATALRWAPDGKSLLVTAAVAVDPDLRGERGDAPPSRSASAAEVCWRLPYKSDGVGYLLQREIHLFAVDAASGATRRLTDGPFDVMGFEASADGQHIAFSRTREGRFANCTDLWVCDRAGLNPRRLTRHHATVLHPVWSPDGRWIAFAGTLKEGDGETRLWLLEFASGRVEPLGPEGLEVAHGEALHWSADSRRLLLVRACRGRHEIVSLSVPGGQLQTLVAGDRQFGAFGCTGRNLVYSVDTPVLPSELHACGPDGRGERQVSLLNAWWGERTPIEMEARQFAVPDGRGGRETIDGWLLRARGHEGPLPLLDDVHGGPASYALLDFDTNVYWQVLCSQGWAVLLLNAVGSSSFGDEFCQRLSGHWGELDLPQHLEALEQLQAEDVCDRVAIAGKSYGGYFASWAIGHCRLFRAAVVMAPVGNIETHYGTSDGGYYADPLYVDSRPRFDRQRARELSPLHYIEQASTPTLFLQGKDDERCPKCQSEELFVSLYRAGETAAELVLYPGEDHHFLGAGKPACRADAARRIVAWMTRHVGEPPIRHESHPAKTEQYEGGSD
jgi:dipeptidyl aminopeptidase/acylaminoacyl peptidase